MRCPGCPINGRQPPGLIHPERSRIINQRHDGTGEGVIVDMRGLPATPSEMCHGAREREYRSIGIGLKDSNRSTGQTVLLTVGPQLASFHYAHATELVNAGVSLETIRRRLGHANAQTVLRYADQHDTTTDAQIRAWRRRKTTRRSAG